MDAFLVRLSISQWTGRKLDKTATREAKDRANATDKAGVKLYKSLVASDALDAIETIANTARIEHRKRTVPWQYDGPGAITAAGYTDYAARMNELQSAFHRAVLTFLNEYETDRSNARSDLGNLFNESDYPTVDAIRQKFSFHVAAEPMPQQGHFQVQGLPENVQQNIKDGITRRNEAALESARCEVWNRIRKLVQNLESRLAAYKPKVNGQDKVEGKFHDTLIENIREFIGLLPSLNITNDPDLARMADRLGKLSQYSAEDLRTSDVLRRDIIASARETIAALTDYALEN